MDFSLYITTGDEFPIVQAIPESINTNTVTVAILRLSDGYTWNFSTEEFASPEVSGSMTFVSGIIWKQAFTPPTDDTYVVTITDVTLDVEYVQYLIAKGEVVTVVETPPSAEVTSSQLAICNLALDRVAQPPITDIDDTTNVQAVVCKRMWDLARKETLRSYPWGFATAVIELTANSTYTPVGWDYAYDYPDDVEMVWHLYTEGTTDKEEGEEFRELYDQENEEKVLVANVDEAYAEVTYNITDPLMFDASFVTAFAYRLAADLAVPLVGDKDLAKAMAEAFNNAISDAKRLSQKGKYVKHTGSSSMIDARQ